MENFTITYANGLKKKPHDHILRYIETLFGLKNSKAIKTVVNM